MMRMESWRMQAPGQFRDVKVGSWLLLTGEKRSFLDSELADTSREPECRETENRREHCLAKE